MSQETSKPTTADTPARGIPPRRVTRAVMVFYIAAALFNGEHLHRSADLMEYGAWRDVCVAVTRPLAYISERSYLSRPRIWLEETLNPEERELL